MLAVLKDLKGADHIDEDAFFFYEERDCIEHLFRVSASLDSLVLGEGQILSQLKGAYIQLTAQVAQAQFSIFYFNVLSALVKRYGRIQALLIRLYPLVTPLLT